MRDFLKVMSAIIIYIMMFLVCPVVIGTLTVGLITLGAKLMHDVNKLMIINE